MLRDADARRQPPRPAAEHQRMPMQTVGGAGVASLAVQPPQDRHHGFGHRSGQRDQPDPWRVNTMDLLHPGPHVQGQMPMQPARGDHGEAGGQVALSAKRQDWANWVRLIGRSGKGGMRQHRWQQVSNPHLHWNASGGRPPVALNEHEVRCARPLGRRGRQIGIIRHPPADNRCATGSATDRRPA